MDSRQFFSNDLLTFELCDKPDSNQWFDDDYSSVYSEEDYQSMLDDNIIEERISIGQSVINNNWVPIESRSEATFQAMMADEWSCDPDQVEWVLKEVHINYSEKLQLYLNPPSLDIPSHQQFSFDEKEEEYVSLSNKSASAACINLMFEKVNSLFSNDFRNHSPRTESASIDQFQKEEPPDFLSYESKQVIESVPDAPTILKNIRNFLDKDFTISNVIEFLTSDEKEVQFLRHLNNYEDKKARIRYNELDFLIVYIPSSGGKSTLFENFEKAVFFRHNKEYQFLDIDEFIKWNHTTFKIVQKQCQLTNDYSLMTKWFKYTLMKKRKDLQKKILLLNHPNQVPNCFRQGFNELVILPFQRNWGLRFFDENYFSLAAIRNKHKVMLRYDQYLQYILDYFNFDKGRIK